MNPQEALNVLYRVARLHHMGGEDHDRVRQAGQVLQEFLTESAKPGSRVPEEGQGG